MFVTAKQNDCRSAAVYAAVRHSLAVPPPGEMYSRFVIRSYRCRPRPPHLRELFDSDGSSLYVVAVPVTAPSTNQIQLGRSGLVREVCAGFIEVCRGNQ